jgi:hypothetical protein
MAQRLPLSMSSNTPALKTSYSTLSPALELRVMWRERARETSGFFLNLFSHLDSKFTFLYQLCQFQSNAPFNIKGIFVLLFRMEGVTQS